MPAVARCFPIQFKFEHVKNKQELLFICCKHLYVKYAKVPVLPRWIVRESLGYSFYLFPYLISINIFFPFILKNVTLFTPISVFSHQ